MYVCKQWDVVIEAWMDKDLYIPTKTEWQFFTAYNSSGISVL